MVDFANPVLHLDLTTMEQNCSFSTDLRKTGVRGSCRNVVIVRAKEPILERR